MARENRYDRSQIDRRSNSRINTHILEGKVFELIRDTMLDPAKLRGFIQDAAGFDDRSAARELARIARKISTLDQERRELIERYAADQMNAEDYITANRALDEKPERLVREKARLAAALRSPLQEHFVDASVRQFCATANARFDACSDVDAKRPFIVDHIDRVIYNHYEVAIVGFVPVPSAAGAAKLPFRIEGRINIKAIRSEGINLILQALPIGNGDGTCKIMLRPPKDGDHAQDGNVRDIKSGVRRR
jgi:hypothetical protein